NNDLDSVIGRAVNSRRQPIDRVLADSAVLAVPVHEITKILGVSYRAETHHRDACLARALEVRLVRFRDHVDPAKADVPTCALLARRVLAVHLFMSCNSGRLSTERPAQSHVMDVEIDPLFYHLGIV